MSLPFPSPTVPAHSRAEVLLGYLEYFRARMVDKIEALPEGELRRSRLPSGWTPIELLKHLTYVELRWLEWGFEGHSVADPWGDSRGDRWYVADGETLDDLTKALRAQAERSRAVIEDHDLADAGQPGPRWDGSDPATLERILLHLVQEYARHLGHLDIVAELAVKTPANRAPGAEERMSVMTDDFHPNLVPARPNLIHVRADQIDAETAQSSGMHRFAAISNAKVGSSRLWMGQTHVRPATRSADHHHGEAETAIYVVSGTPEFVFLDDHSGEEVRVRAAPGDYIFVPPYTPHREENNDPDVEAVVVLARSTQEAIVINLPSLSGRD